MRSNNLPFPYYKRMSSRGYNKAFNTNYFENIHVLLLLLRGIRTISRYFQYNRSHDNSKRQQFNIYIYLKLFSFSVLCLSFTRRTNMNMCTAGGRPTASDHRTWAFIFYPFPDDSTWNHHRLSKPPARNLLRTANVRVGLSCPFPKTKAQETAASLLHIFFLCRF